MMISLRGAWQPLSSAGLMLVVGCSTKGSSQASASVEKELGPGSFDLLDPRVGLDALSSYESSLTVTFEGSQAGRAARWSSTTRLRVSAAPPGRYLSVATAGVERAASRLSLAVLGGAGYQIDGADECSAPPLELVSTRLDALDPAASLPGVLGAEQAETGTTGGASATRYRFDERALGQAGMNHSTGELWLATERPRLLRYRLTTTGDTSYFGNATTGSVTWDYYLIEEKQPQPIELPAVCPSGLLDLPLLPSSAEVERDPGVLRYRAKATVAEALDFYQKELSALGWRAPSRSDPLAELANDPAVREALADPQVRSMMKRMGLQSTITALGGDSAPDASGGGSGDEAYRTLRKGREELRLLVTRADSGTQILLLSGARARSPGR